MFKIFVENSSSVQQKKGGVICVPGIHTSHCPASVGILSEKVAHQKSEIFFNDVSFGSCTNFPSCGFCPNRILLYFPLYPRPSVCEILHFSNVYWHICHMNHQRTQETPDILKPNNLGYLSRPDQTRQQYTEQTRPNCPHEA